MPQTCHSPPPRGISSHPLFIVKKQTQDCSGNESQQYTYPCGIEIYHLHKSVSILFIQVDIIKIISITYNVLDKNASYLRRKARQRTDFYRLAPFPENAGCKQAGCTAGKMDQRDRRKNLRTVDKEGGAAEKLEEHLARKGDSRDSR